MNERTLLEILQTLIGSIEASGCHSTDEDRLQNLNEWINLTEDMVYLLTEVTRTQDDYRQSMRVIGQRALMGVKDINVMTGIILEELEKDNE